jgi:hypothetical protein
MLNYTPIKQTKQIKYMQSILLFTHVVWCTLNVCTSVSCEFVIWIVDCKLEIDGKLYTIATNIVHPIHGMTY